MAGWMEVGRGDLDSKLPHLQAGARRGQGGDNLYFIVTGHGGAGRPG